MVKKTYGIDVGNGYVKYNKGKFASRVDIGVLEEPFGEIHSITYKGVNYIIGSTNGTSVLTEDKYFTDNYLMLLLSGIALSGDVNTLDIEANIVIGVPATQYKKEKRDSIKAHLIGRCEEIIVDGVSYVIYIKDVEVAMEGGLVLKNNNNDKVLVIDIGAGTVNAVLWEQKRKMFEDTINKSFQSLLINMSTTLKKYYDYNVEAEKLEKFVGADTVKIKGAVVEVPELKELLKNFVDGVVGNIQRNPKLEWASCDSIEIMGGGAISTYPIFKEYFPHANLVEDSQFINQEVYDLVAKVKFGR